MSIFQTILNYTLFPIILQISTIGFNDWIEYIKIETQKNNTKVKKLAELW